MNLKKAKAIRRFVEDKFAFLPALQYEQNALGTRRLSLGKTPGIPACRRGMYQHIKTNITRGITDGK